MDDPACPREDLEKAFRDLARLNRFLGAAGVVRLYLDRVLPSWQARRSPRPFTILDVGTGGGDIPALVAGWARGRGIPARIVAVDRHPTSVGLAREVTASTGCVAIVRADARWLPVADGGVDASLCTLTLHHLDPPEAVLLLRELDRVSRHGFLVIDLLRSGSGYWAVWALTRLSTSALIRHDGPVSVRRSRSWEEYRDLAEAAGIPSLRVRRLPLFRVALECVR
jgi:ubiquinone/menaquinone biosynthesis C-methylase UbiE